MIRKTFRNSIDSIAYLLSRSTVRDEVGLKCVYNTAGEQVECELDRNQPHALRFGAAQKVMFIADTTALPGGKCTARIENQGLGAAPRTVVLPEGQATASLKEDALQIELSRNSDRLYLTIDVTGGRVNGDWQIKLTMDAPAGAKP